MQPDYLKLACSPTGVRPVLQVHPTRRCNLSCMHCYTASSPKIREEIPLEILTACLEDAATWGYGQLALSGGEPLLYPELPSLLKQAHSLGMQTTLTTNGMLVTRESWALLAPWLDVVAVSIDGVPAKHDALRCKVGAFSKTCRNLEVIRQSKVPFGLIFTLTQYNVDSLEWIVRFAAEQGARSVQVHPLTLSGRAQISMPDACPDDLELMAALCESLRLADELDIAVHVDALSRDQVMGFRDHLVPQQPVECLASVAPVLIVQADGYVVPLTHEVNRKFWLGSLWQSRLSTLAKVWLKQGLGDRLAQACAQTWRDLADIDSQRPALYWYDEVAARTDKIDARVIDAEGHT